MVQACHAAQEVVRCHIWHDVNDPVSPVDERTTIRLLHVKDSTELLQFHTKLNDRGFYTKLIYEPDPPWNHSPMALATEPSTVRISVLSKIFYHLPRARFDVA
jgi:hypothetical protein